MLDKLRIKQFLLILLIISSVFSHMIFIPRIGYKLQLTEIVFILLSLFFIIDIRNLKRIRFQGLDKVFIFYILILILNLLLHPEKTVLITIIGSFYLIVLYFILSKYLISLPNKNIKYVLKKSSDIGFWILISIGVIGFALHYFLDYSRFVLIYHNYPYFGDVFRIKGFSYSPNLYISLLSLFTILKLAFSKLNFYHIFIIFLISLLTLTKEALILISILFAISLYKNTRYYKFALVSVVITGIIYVFLSFFIISIHNSSDHITIDKRVQNEVAVYEGNSFSIYSTSYFEVFKNGVFMTTKHPIVGVGLGNFRNELKKYQKKDLYPEYFQTYDPLDSYTGQASQLGIIYFVYLGFLFALTLRLLLKLPVRIKFSFLLYFVYILFESVALGTYNFRHYILFFAIISTISYLKLDKKESKHYLIT